MVRLLIKNPPIWIHELAGGQSRALPPSPFLDILGGAPHLDRTIFSHGRVIRQAVYT